MTVVVEVDREPHQDFIKIPFLLYDDDPFFVPQLNREMRVHFSSGNPFFRFADARFFVARRNGAPAGRIVSFVNSRHNDRYGDKTGFFGFFECTDDFETAALLFEEAGEYLKSRGMTSIMGPMNFSTNEECGFLVEGFHEPPVLMMPYNPPYYGDMAVRCGFEKVKDLYAYNYEIRPELPDKVVRVASLAEKNGISVRNINMKKFREEMGIFREVYHSAWADNWGFVPMTDEELDYAGERLRQIAVSDFILIAEKDGEPVGFFGLIPDFNFVLKKMKGRLNPVSVAKALYYSRKITGLRLMLLGVKKEFRNRGVEALMFSRAFEAVKKGPYERAEFSWILEDNVHVQRLIGIFGGTLYKTYRIYEKKLQPGG